MRHVPFVLVGISLVTYASDCSFQMRLNDPEGFSTLVIEVHTDGGPTDENGYELSVSRAGERLGEPIRLLVDDSRQLELEGTADRVDVLLEDVAPHCHVSGENPQRTSSTAGSRAVVSFEIRCGAGP